jgi:hypothetical protein
LEDGSVPQTPWHRAKQARQTRRARRNEEELAKTTGGRRQPASGALSGRKGDVRENGFLVDDKFTDAKSFTITREMWLKITREAGMSPPGLRPRLRLTLPGIPKLCVLLEDDYLYLQARAEIANANAYGAQDHRGT